MQFENTVMATVKKVAAGAGKAVKETLHPAFGEGQVCKQALAGLNTAVNGVCGQVAGRRNKLVCSMQSIGRITGCTNIRLDVHGW
ncbi:hypothetical protein LJC56_03365 [Christensenellaceae bacterium OttesenSCG-928-K19]|nr:hypothetical protein [Christensenellaceae bacterium OttesenSCG-928-K19]